MISDNQKGFVFVQGNTVSGRTVRITVLKRFIDAKNALWNTMDELDNDIEGLFFRVERG